MLIKQFNEISKNDASSAGGKGASLGEMSQAGIPVPSGFVILAAAFERFLREAKLHSQIDAILHKVDHRAMHTVEQASEEIKALILNAEMPKDIAQEILIAFQKLNTQFVAIRSSATAEDSSIAAWAGQLESYLNTTKENLLENVKKCWASLFTPRAIFYRFEQNLHEQHISVAVVVQKMVESEVSGIAFSVHPVTQDYNQLIIEAGLGLGEAIVSGQITPDSYVVEKKRWEIIENNVSTQTKALYRSGKGGNEWKEVSGSTQKLSDPQIIELAKLVVKIEQHYGFPVDVEWALEKGKFYIVQSRPITTLKLTDNEEREIVEMVAGDNWYFLGYWPQHIFSASFWADWYDKKTINDLGLEIRPPGLVIYNNGKFVIDGNEVERVKKWLKKKVQDADFLDKFNRKVSNIYKINSEFKLDSSKNLELELKRFIAQAKRIMTLWTIGVFISQAAQKIWSEQFPSNQSKFYAQYIPKIVTPLSELQVGLSKISKNKSKIKELLIEYAWTKTVNFVMAELSENDLHFQEKETSSEKQEKIPNTIATFLSCFSKAGYLKQAGAEYFSKLSYYGYPLLQKAVSYVGITYEELLLTPYVYLVKAIADKEKPELLPNTWLVYQKNGRLRITTNSEVIAQWSNTFDVKKIISSEISGTVAFPGKIKGEVSIISGSKDFSKFKKGNILVTTMTTPDFLPLMKQSSAVVTDIGGLLSHAAIISREMKKPCIIGTKIATQILKDGDLVEVDANQGIVTILKSTKIGLTTAEQKSFKKEDYILSFWVRGVSVFVMDIHLGVYKALEVLYIIDNGMFKQYFTIKAYEQALDRGVAFYSDKKAFDHYKKDLSSHCDRFKVLFETKIRDKKHLSSKIVTQFLEYTQKLCGDYTKMNFEFTDKAFAHQEENLIIKKNLSGVAKFKDSVRSVMNIVLFDANGYLNQFFTILRKQFNLSPQLLDNLTQQEILDLFVGKRPIESIVSKRQEAFVESYDVDGFYEGKEAEIIIQEFRENAAYSEIIRGQIACAGKIIGKVKIIPVDYSDLSRVNAEIEKMNKGDILVAETTAPELMVACKKSGAIVTDMGGLMSHAAIVSREFGIPCIVGTKNASKILKDGDVIEVDAENGIVRKIPLVQGWPLNGEIFHWGPIPGRFIWPGGEFMDVCCEVVANKFGGLRWPPTLVLFKGKRMLWLNEWPALRSFGKNIFLRYMLPEQSWKEIYSRWLTVVKELLLFEKKIDPLYLQKLSNQDLSKQWNTFHDLLKEFWVLTIPAELGNYGAPDLLQEELKEYIQNEKELMMAMEVLTAPEKFSFYQQEEIDLVKTDNLNKHQQQYFWLKNSYVGVQVLDVNFFAERQKKLPIHLEKELLDNLKKTIQRKKDIAKKYQLPASLLHLAKVISQNVAWQDERKKYIFKNLHVKNIFLEEIARRFSYKYDDLLNCWYTEIADIIQSKNLHKMLLERCNGFGVYFDSAVRILSFSEALRYWEHYAEEKVEAVNQFSGIVACAGKEKKVKGAVRILLDPYDVDSFQEGEILIAPMTSPEYIFAMKKAKAIITDTGGLTSHAAIVSRELGIPCIVGTKIATKVLKDGDMVEVDADKGVVKKIKKN